MQIRAYRPSNGTEGMSFIDDWCGACMHQGTCQIPARTMALDVRDPDYPREWCYDENNDPVCTAYQKDAEHPPAPQRCTETLELPL